MTTQDKFNCKLLKIKYQQNREELKISCHLTRILETMKKQKGLRQDIKRTLTSVQRQKESAVVSVVAVVLEKELRCPKFFCLA